MNAGAVDAATESGRRYIIRIFIYAYTILTVCERAISMDLHNGEGYNTILYYLLSLFIIMHNYVCSWHDWIPKMECCVIDFNDTFAIFGHRIAVKWITSIVCIRTM